ncbi:MAG: capsid protein [Guiyang argiope bruennichi dicistrovirus 1]|nr:MAG: capsid protein [Guiyang argiope bruennichi dicistrovirus 1]
MYRFNEVEHLFSIIRVLASNGGPTQEMRDAFDTVVVHFDDIKQLITLLSVVIEDLDKLIPFTVRAKEQSGVVETTQATQQASADDAPTISNSTAERQEVTEFIDDNAVLHEAAPGETPLAPIVSQQHTDANQHSIITFLARPQLIDEFEMSPSAKRGELLTTIRVPDKMLTPMVLAKLDGFTSFRGTAVFKLQLNSQPFQAGRLMLFAVPMPTLTYPRDEWITQHVTTAQALHNVQIDFAQETEVELRVPFVSPFNSYNLIDGKYPWADMYVMVYSSLNQVEKYSLQCLLWAHFEDVELGAPTSAKAAKPKQQSGSVPSSGNKAPKEISAVTARKVQAAESTGILSQVSSGAQSAYATLGKGIPAISGVTGALSTFSKSATDFFGGILGAIPSLAKLVGLSKPPVGYSGNTVVIRPTQYFQNTDGVDHSNVLSLSALNSVDEYPTLGGNNLSETSMTFLKSIPQYIGNFCYGKTSKYGTELFTGMVAPNHCVPGDYIIELDNPSLPGGVIQPTVLNYISSSFLYWTGSLVYTFRFVKTKFHSGRVEVSYHPFTTDVDDTRMDYVYRLVVDLRDNSEVSVTIPYISTTPWKKTDSQNNPLDLKPWSAVGDSVTGVIHVRALTPLICASSVVSDNIECLVEVRGGPDYEVSAPAKNGFFPFSFQEVATQQSGVVYATPGTFETRTQAIEGKLPPSITGRDSDINRPSPSMYTIGEQFTDFRALTRRFAFMSTFTREEGRVIVRDSPYYVIPPFAFFQELTKDDKKVNQFVFAHGLCPLSFVSGMYAFYRGSLRAKIYGLEPGDLISAQMVDKEDYGYAQNPLPSYNYISAEAYEQVEFKKFAEFQFPYYSPTVCTVPYPLEKPNKLFTQPKSAILISTSNQEDNDLYMAAAAGDDMSFHMFLGVPPVLDRRALAINIDNNNTYPSFVNRDNINTDPCVKISGNSTEGWKLGTAKLMAIVNWSITDRTQGCPGSNIPKS